MQHMCSDTWECVASFCDDDTFCNLRRVVRLPWELGRSVRRAKGDVDACLRRASCASHGPRSCAIPYCHQYAVRHVLWISENSYVPWLPYCLRHCVLVGMIQKYDLLCIDEINRVHFVGASTPIVLGLPPL